MKVKIIGLLVAVVLVAAMVAVAARATSAYFSDTKQRADHRHNRWTSASTTSGGAVGVGDGLNFFWDEMLPGVTYTAPMSVQNTSSSNSEDVWIVFPNLTALSALNSLGRFGAVTIDVNGAPVFHSNNLNDNLVRGNHINLGVPDTTGALPTQLKLASSLGPTASITVDFKFAYASALSAQEPGGVFNQYPVIARLGNECLTGDAYYNGSAFLVNTLGPPYPYSGSGNTNTDPAFTYYAQVTVRGGDAPGNGLPFQIVATEPGIQPGDPGSYAPILP